MSSPPSEHIDMLRIDTDLLYTGGAIQQPADLLYAMAPTTCIPCIFVREDVGFIPVRLKITKLERLVKYFSLL